MRKRKNDVDDQISAAWTRLASGVEVSVMSIPTIFSEIRAALSAGTALDDAVKAAIAKHRQN